MFQAAGGPSSGGVSRGRGDAALSLGAETPHDSGAFAPKRLDPAKAADREQLELLGIGSTAPKASDAGEATGLQQLGPSTGDAAWRRRVAPRHRRAVGAFFGGAEER